MDRYPERASRPTLSTSDKKEEAVVAKESAPIRSAPRSGLQEKKSRGSTKLIVIGAVGFVIVALLAWWFFGRNLGVPSYIAADKYQVVCLQSGECYFGKITSMTSDTVQIKNVFYVQKTATATDKTDTTSAGDNLQLIKLGDEVHGPEDMMAISRSQVLYVENLKSDGKVSQTITTYYQQNKD